MRDVPPLKGRQGEAHLQRRVPWTATFLPLRALAGCQPGPQDRKPVQPACNGHRVSCPRWLTWTQLQATMSRGRLAPTAAAFTSRGSVVLFPAGPPIVVD